MRWVTWLVIGSLVAFGCGVAVTVTMGSAATLGLGAVALAGLAGVIYWRLFDVGATVARLMKWR